MGSSEINKRATMTASIEGSGGGGKEKEGEVSAMDAGDDPVTVLLARGVVVGGEDYFIFIGIDGKDPNPKERKMRYTVGFWERADEFLDPGECYFICADGGGCGHGHHRQATGHI